MEALKKEEITFSGCDDEQAFEMRQQATGGRANLTSSEKLDWQGKKSARPTVFISREGDRWICQNVRCRCEFEVVKACVVNSGSNARCCCGSEMTRRYVAPSIRRVDAAELETFLEEAELPLKTSADRPKHSKT